MIQLVIPSKHYLQSYQEAYDGYIANSVTTYGFDNPREIDIFDKHARYRQARDITPGHVGEDFYWLADTESDQFIGQITIRHELTENLCRCGGHIGYGIRYSHWGRGYGTKMLALALEKAKERGLERVLLTCNDDNIASARVMEKNGFQLDDKILDEGILIRRYWKTL